MRGLRLALALTPAFVMLATGPAFAEWSYLVPDAGGQPVHRAFAFADKSDDRIEFACTTGRRDLFYSTEQTVSDAGLAELKSGKPTILVRLDGVGVVPFPAGDAYQKGGRLYFVTAVSAALITDLGKANQPVAAGIQANSKILQQSTFSTKGLAAAMKGLAAGCGF